MAVFTILDPGSKRKNHYLHLYNYTKLLYRCRCRRTIHIVTVSSVPCRL